MVRAQQEAAPTRFQAWARKYGPTRLAERLTAMGPDTMVTFGAVYNWIRGEHEPRGPKVRAMVELSRGEISSDDIQDHFVLCAKRRAAVKSS